MIRRLNDARHERRVDQAFDADLADVLEHLPRAVRPVMEHRLRVVLDALGQPVLGGATPDLLHGLEAAFKEPDASSVWLTLAVLTAELPVDADVVDVVRHVRLDGPRRAFAATVAGTAHRLAASTHAPRDVEVVVDAVVVDVHHTWQTDLATGIQRVVWETVSRWERDHDVTPVGWTDDYTALVRLGDLAGRRGFNAFGDDADGRGAATDRDAAVLIPFGGSFIVPELAAEPTRSERILALARHSGNRTGTIGYDCVPLTTAETVAEGMGTAFARTLAAVRHMDGVAAISHASANEYRGWRAMLAGTGLSGPDVRPVPLPTEAQQVSDSALAAARSRFAVGSLPLVLVVGSHEPRKNHLAVLHAAELLWRRGSEFSLLFVGGNTWRSEQFSEQLKSLRAAGRPIEATLKLSEDLLWAAYRLAHVALFPSLNEGYGLPVAEALAFGTPVVTSGYGSMAEIAQDGGALVVDPRDDHAVAAAVGRLLDDPELHRELTSQAEARPLRTWDSYAAEVWAHLVEGDARA
jgi:glycosyltransferase involved in cell wall biosynthesis